MAYLHSVLGAMLRDVTEAQHLANSYSASLSQTYRENSLLQTFTVPNAFIEELELEIKYANADKGAREKDSGEFDYQPAKTFFEQVLDDEIPGIVKSVMRLITRTGNDLTGYDEFLELRDQLIRDFPAHLNNRIAERLEAQIKSIIRPDGKPDPQLVSALIIKLFHEELMDPGDLAILSEDNRNLRDQVGKLIDSMVADVVDRITQDFPALSPFCYYQMDVIVGAAELARLPESMIHTARFKLNMRNYTLSQTEEQGSVTNHLLPS